MVTVTVITAPGTGRGYGRYVRGSLAVATECLCVLVRIHVCVYQFLGVHPIGARSSTRSLVMRAHAQDTVRA